jgi:hypothetical protein
MGCQQDGSVSLHHADRDGHQRPHLLEPAGARLCRRARRPERQRPRPARCRGDARIATRVRGITAGRQLPALAAPRRSAPPSSRPGMRSRMATSGGCSASTWCWRGCRSSCLHSPTCSPPPPGERLGRGGIDSSRNPSPDLLPLAGQRDLNMSPKSAGGGAIHRARRGPACCTATNAATPVRNHYLATGGRRSRRARMRAGLPSVPHGGGVKGPWVGNPLPAIVACRHEGVG